MSEKCVHWPGQQRCDWCDLGKEPASRPETVEAPVGRQHLRDELMRMMRFNFDQKERRRKDADWDDNAGKVADDMLRAMDELWQSEQRPAPALCEDEGCPQHGTPHVCVSPPAAPTTVNAINASLAEKATLRTQLAEAEALATTFRESLRAVIPLTGGKIASTGVHDALLASAAPECVERAMRAKATTIAAQAKRTAELEAGLRSVIKRGAFVSDNPEACNCPYCTAVREARALLSATEKGSG